MTSSEEAKLPLKEMLRKSGEIAYRNLGGETGITKEMYLIVSSTVDSTRD